MRKPLFAIAVLALALVSVQADSARAGEARTHDGFFLRLAPGFGSAKNRIEAGADHIEFSGTSGDVDIAIGGMIQPNLALHGTLFGWSVTDPDADIALGGLAGSGSTKGSATMGAFGGGATYYFMPVNIYISGSLGLGSFTFEPDGGNKYETDSGLAFELTAGKEWWVGKSWGLGVAGDYIYSSLPDKDSSSDSWVGNAFAVRFTATLN